MASSHKMIALSQRERQSMIPRRYRNKTTVIYNGIDQGRFRPPTGLRPEGEPFKVLYIGQLIDLKRVHLAISLIRRYLDSGIDARLKVYSHRPTLLPELTEYARRMLVLDRVEFKEALTQDEVAEAMRGSNLFVLPSRSEALSTVITEAVLCHLPVLTFNVGGAKEQLPESWVCPEPEEIEAWMQEGLRIADQWKHAEEQVSHFANTARTRFSIARMVTQHVETYEELVG